MDKQKAADIVGCAADLIEQKGWCQKSYAKSCDGSIVEPYSDDATSFCLVGALRKCIGVAHRAGPATLDHLGQDIYDSLIDRLVNLLGENISPIGFNDQKTTTKNMVIDLLKTTQRELLDDLNAR